MAYPFREAGRVLDTVRYEQGEEAGEEEHLAREEDPHAQACRVRLLFHRLEVTLAAHFRHVRPPAASRSRTGQV